LEYGDQAAAVKASKPNEFFNQIIGVLESKYSCSGICSQPLFYYTQSITKGPPTQGCFSPLVEDFGSDIRNLGIVMVVTGILFLFMPFCAIPICCRKSEDEDDEEVRRQKEKEKERKKKEGEDFDDPAKIEGTGKDTQANNMA